MQVKLLRSLTLPWARCTQYGGFVVKALLNLGGDIEQEARPVVAELNPGPSFEMLSVSFSLVLPMVQSQDYISITHKLQ